MRAEGQSRGMMPRGMLLLSMVTFLCRRLGTAPGRPQSNISEPDAKGSSRRKKSTAPNTAADAVRIAESAHHAGHFEVSKLHVCMYAPVHVTICMVNLPDHVNVGATSCMHVYMSVRMHPCIFVYTPLSVRMDVQTRTHTTFSSCAHRSAALPTGAYTGVTGFAGYTQGVAPRQRGMGSEHHV